MTVSELKNLLDSYPDDMEVRVADYNPYIEDVDHESPSLEVRKLNSYGWEDPKGKITVLATCAE